jgi:hypothetical protein
MLHILPSCPLDLQSNDQAGHAHSQAMHSAAAAHAVTHEAGLPADGASATIGASGGSVPEPSVLLPPDPAKVLIGTARQVDVP